MQCVDLMFNVMKIILKCLKIRNLPKRKRCFLNTILFTVYKLNYDIYIYIYIQLLLVKCGSASMYQKMSVVILEDV